MNIETYDIESERLAIWAIRNPTKENIDAATKAAIDNATKLTEYIINGNRISKST